MNPDDRVLFNNFLKEARNFMIEYGREFITIVTGGSIIKGKSIKNVGRGNRSQYFKTIHEAKEESNMKLNDELIKEIEKLHVGFKGVISDRLFSYLDANSDKFSQDQLQEMGDSVPFIASDCADLIAEYFSNMLGE